MKKALIITGYMENINGLKFVCPICVKSRRLSRNNASRELYTHAQKQCEKGLLRICCVTDLAILMSENTLNEGNKFTEVFLYNSI